MRFPRIWACAALALGIGMHFSAPLHAQMVTRDDMPGYGEAFGLKVEQKSKNFTVAQTASSLGANVLWPGESAELTFIVNNPGAAPLNLKGFLETIAYNTRVEVGDVWTPKVTRESVAGQVPVEVAVPAKSTATFTVKPTVPDKFGGYVCVFDFGEQGRAFGAAVVRTARAEAGKVFEPSYALDLPWPFEMSDAVTKTFGRLGVRGARMGVGYTPSDNANFQNSLNELEQHLKWAQDNNITVMLTIGAGPVDDKSQPLGRGRPWLDENGVMKDTKFDAAWLPQYDDDFQKWVTQVVAKWGWPRGPVNAVELWNEPWEGISISGWGADNMRYRELYERMARGVEDARRGGAQVLIGGACSSSNTWDKLFPDGDKKFLPWLDFVSIHYQEMAASPSLVRMWQERKGPYGRVRVWDTESWVANSEDRVAGVIASMRAQGQDRTAGIFQGNVYTPQWLDANGKYDFDGRRRKYPVAQAWAPAAAVAAVNQFIGQRAYRGLLFQNGLPWIFVFDGRRVGRELNAQPAGNPDDGTVVVLGDLGGLYNRDKTLFRGVKGLQNAPRIAELQAKIAALPDGSKERDSLDKQLKAASVLSNAKLTLSSDKGRFKLLDFYGNPLPEQGGAIEVPLSGLGYFLRTDGSKGSFEALLKELGAARIEGYEPLDVVVHDWTTPLTAQPPLHLTLTNVLNRPVQGVLRVEIENKLAYTAPLEFGANQTQEVVAPVTVAPRADNRYALKVRFVTGRDGMVEHDETLHANVIARRSIRVDGNLDEAEWKGVLPQVLSAQGLAKSLAEYAWQPFLKFENATQSGTATGYLAYDDKNFYFAAKIADATPDEGNVRFATRDDDAYFYPAVSYEVAKDGTKRELKWPDGVRRYSYRRDPDLPSGNAPKHDNVQIAFNTIPVGKDDWLSHPIGAPDRWMVYKDTDYEYALNDVAARYGGGTELWRMQVPGMPRKHFYPRQPKWPGDKVHTEGAVKNGSLATRRDGSTRFVECALPWSEIPDVKKLLDAGKPVKFSFRVNDNNGPAYELAQDRSVSKINDQTFHVDWVTHWANEVEFGWEK
jgi:hypothetical protein